MDALGYICHFSAKELAGKSLPSHASMSILITKPQKRLATGRVNTTGDNVVSNCLETVWGLSTRPKRKVADASTLSISTAKDSNQYDLPDPKPKKKRTKEQSAESRGLADIASFLEETDAEVSLLQGMVRQTVNELRDIVLRVKELYPLCWAHRLRLIQDLMLCHLTRGQVNVSWMQSLQEVYFLLNDSNGATRLLHKVILNGNTSIFIYLLSKLNQLIGGTKGGTDLHSSATCSLSTHIVLGDERYVSLIGSLRKNSSKPFTQEGWQLLKEYLKILPDNFQSLVLRTWQPQPMKLTTLDYSTLLQGKLTCLTLFSEDKLNTKLRELINHGVAAPDAIEPEQALPGIANTDAIPLDPLGGLVEGSMSAALDPTNDIVGDYSSRLLHWKTGKKPPKLEDVLATRFLASFTQLPLLYFHDNALFKQKIEKSVKFLLSCRHLLATLPRVIEDTAQANNLDFACLSAWIDMANMCMEHDRKVTITTTIMRYPSDPINPEHLSTVAITSPLYSIPCDKSKDRLFSQHATAPLSFSLCNTSESDGHASTSLSASSVPSTTSPLTVAELPASAMSSAEHLQEELGFTTVAKFTHEVKQKKRGRPADIGKFVKPVHSADANDMLSFLSTRFLTAYWTTPLSYFRYHSESKLLLQECLQQFLATVKDESEVKLEVNSERANMLASEHMVDLDWLKKWLFVMTMSFEEDRQLLLSYSTDMFMLKECLRLAVIPDYAFPEDVLRRVPFPVLMIKKRAKPTTPTDQDNSDQLALDMQSSVAEASCVDLNPIDGMDGCVY